MESKVKEAIRVTEGVSGRGTGKIGGWWDMEYSEKKKEVRKELRGWRRVGRMGGGMQENKERKQGTM
ncbi:hypothetical protein EAG_12120 [Camponotus floridanus]|uniref:Uncharacterized protein n=1 Tax=Camponotus floridanus TaxID=104421 RepID=E2A462_CAMFO|nr:hypothetical protein EAG_12120 [Camponotus floridanus]